jgi:hypothetical protein
MFSSKVLQDAADALSEARGRFAVAMANPKDTIELNEAKAELARLQDIVGAISDQRAYGSGCDYDRRGHRDLHGHDETGANDVLYAGTRRYLDQDQTGAHVDEARVTNQRAQVDWDGDNLPRKSY